ncbi:MAG: twin-arginine translocase subunit TatC [Bacteroidetes bacterium]|nr:twin-arginine translocase subunit TatC [Bacteroidota bacterium]
MTFMDHIEELRWHLVRSIIVVLAMTVLAFVFKNILFDQIIFGPKRLDFWTYRALCDLGYRIYGDDSLCIKEFSFRITNISMSGQFTSHLFISFLAGIVLAFPYIIWEIWRFVKPALHATEKNKTRGVVFYGSLLFAAGVLFGYYFLSPISVNFMGSYKVSDEVENYISLDSYLNFVASLTFGSGLLFELPLAIFFLAKIGLITSDYMKRYRSYAFVIILIISAIVTPPDVASQILMTLPIYGLYEIGIWIARRVEKRQAL